MHEKDLIIVAGPVIIEDNKILLNREIKKGNIESPFFMLPGGKVKPEESPRHACIREAAEELGISIEIIRPLETMIVDRPDNPGSKAILIHYLAKRISDIRPPAEATVEWGWFDIDDLPKNCTDNIYTVVDLYLNESSV